MKGKCSYHTLVSDSEHCKNNHCFIIGNAPQLHELQQLTFDDGKELRIMETVVPKWKQAAAAIGFNAARINTIDRGEHFKPEDATFEMFSRWRKGEHSLKPVTWDTLIQSLEEANLKEIAAMLCNVQIVSY